MGTNLWNKDVAVTRFGGPNRQTMYQITPNDNAGLSDRKYIQLLPEEIQQLQHALNHIFPDNVKPQKSVVRELSVSERDLMEKIIETLRSANAAQYDLIAFLCNRR